MRWLIGLLAFGLLGTAPGPGPGAAIAAEPALVGIIIDDLGDQRALGEAAVDLPGAVTLSILPLTPHARHLAERAHAQGKEVMVHLPMQAMEHRPLGPGGLHLDMSEGQFLGAVAQALEAVPYVSGVNNHMGSLLTRHPGHMDWLMRALRDHGPLYFVDSRTTGASVAQMLAHEHGLPAMRRDVFLDHHPDPAAIERQLERLIERARHTGWALGIGHPYPSTLEVLQRSLPELAARGVRLVSVSELIHETQHRRAETWRLSLSP